MLWWRVCPSPVSSFRRHLPQVWKKKSLGEILSDKRDQNQKQQQSQSQNEQRKTKVKKKLYAVETRQKPEYESDGGTMYTKSFHSLEIPGVCFQDTKKVREEVFTTLAIRLPESDSSQCALPLKIDSGASGNVLPLRTMKQMYGEDALVKCKQIKPTPGLSMTSYNEHIKYHGKLILPCKYKSSQWYNETF